MPRCPICNAEVKPRSENNVFPFCCQRCKTIDLGKWLSEDYRVPAQPGEDAGDDDEASQTGEGSHSGEASQAGEAGSPSGRDVRH